MGVFLTVISSTLKVLGHTEYAIVPPIILLGIRLIEAIIGRISAKTKKLVIVGTKGSGKTTLWNQLRSVRTDMEYRPTVYKDQIKKFKIKSEHGEMTIASTYDIGGDDTAVPDYDTLIKDSGTFIYFLFDISETEKRKREICARLYKICSIIKDGNLENCGLKILATHLDLYKLKSREEILSYIKKTLNLKNEKYSNFKLDEKIELVNLLDSDTIESLKNEIIGSLNI